MKTADEINCIFAGKVSGLIEAHRMTTMSDHELINKLRQLDAAFQKEGRERLEFLLKELDSKTPSQETAP